jgi:O-antigen/teichoic acid export membrane protein
VYKRATVALVPLPFSFGKQTQNVLRKVLILPICLYWFSILIQILQIQISIVSSSLHDNYRNEYAILVRIRQLAIDMKSQPQAPQVSVRSSTLDQLFDRDFFSSSSIIFAGSFVVNVLNYVFTLIMSRLLGVESFGEVTALVSLLTIIAVPASALTMLMTREVAYRNANSPDNVRDLFIFLRRHVFLAAIGSWVIFLIVSPLLSYFLHLPYGLFAVFSLLLPFSVASALQTGTLQGLQEFFTLSKQNVLSTIIKLAVAIILVYAGFSVSGVIIAIVCAQAASWLFGYIMTHTRLGLNTPRTIPADAKPFDSRPLRLFFTMTLITSFLLALLSNTDILLARHFLSGDVTGQYGGLATLGNIITYGIGAFTTVLLPMAAAAHAKGIGGERRILRLSLAIITVCVVTAWALFSLFPSFIITLLFGTRYLAIAPILGHYAIAEGCMALSIALINYFVAVRNTTFIYFVSLGIATEVILISINHASITAITTMLIASSALLLSLLIANYFIFCNKGPATNLVDPANPALFL